MRFHGWNRQQKLTHFFSIPNEIFLLGLAHGELAVYCYLKYLEDRKTHQCWPSYRNIGKAVGMSENTVRKYVAMSLNQSTILSKINDINAIYMPIHQDELRLNPLLEQNPFYKTSDDISKN